MLGSIFQAEGKIQRKIKMHEVFFWKKWVVIGQWEEIMGNKFQKLGWEPDLKRYRYWALLSRHHSKGDEELLVSQQSSSVIIAL